MAVLTISEIRAKYPQYSKLSDTELGDALHQKFYPQLGRTEFFRTIGLDTSGRSPIPPVMPAPGANPGRQDAVATPLDAQGAIAAALGSAPAVAGPAAAQGLRAPQEPVTPDFLAQTDPGWSAGGGPSSAPPSPAPVPWNPPAVDPAIPLDGGIAAALGAPPKPDMPDGLTQKPQGVAQAGKGKAPAITNAPMVAQAGKANQPAPQPSPVNGIIDALTGVVASGMIKAAENDVIVKPAVDAALATQMGLGVQSGFTGAKQMGTAAALIPLDGIQNHQAKLLDLYAKIDALPPGTSRNDAFSQIGVDPESREAVELYRYVAAPEAERAARRKASAETVLGTRETAMALTEQIKAYTAQLQATQGRVPNFSDIGDVSDFADWAGYSVGQAIPYMAALGAAGIVGGMPAVVGSGYVMGVGDIKTEMVNQGVEGGNAAAMVGGIPYAALEFLGPVATMFRGVSKPVLNEVAKGYFRRLGRQVPQQAIEEFINEAGQEIVKDVSVGQGGGKPVVLNDQTLLNWFNSGMAGLAMGTALSPLVAMDGGDQPPAAQPGVTQPPAPAQDAAPVVPAQTPPPAPVTAPAAQPVAPPVDQIAAALGAQAPSPPAAPATTPPENAVTPPAAGAGAAGTITQAEVDAAPDRFEVFPGSEGSDAQGNWKASGTVAVDMKTGAWFDIVPDTAPPVAPDLGTTSPEPEYPPQAEVPNVPDEPQQGPATDAQIRTDQPKGGAKGAQTVPGTAPIEQPEAGIPADGQSSGTAAPDANPAGEQPSALTPAAPPPLDARPIKKDVAVTPTGRRVNVEYAVVDLKNLVPSNFDDGRINPAYPQERQPRDRTGDDTELQIQDKIAKFDPRLLDMNPNADAGAPIVDRNGIVESGNGRTMGLTRIYRDRPDLAQKYRDHLAAQGYPVDGVSQPVLVRIRQDDFTPDQIETYTKEMNSRTGLAMTAPEQARSDAAALPDAAMSLYRGGDMDKAENAAFVSAFIKHVVPQNEQSQMRDKEGKISIDAIRRIQSAMLAKAYGSDAIIAKLIESADVNIKAIGGALLDVAPRWAQMRAEARTDGIAPQMDQTEALLEAVAVADRARTSGRNVAEFVKQRDLLSGEGVSPMGEAFLSMMFRDRMQWTRPVGRDMLAKTFGWYLDKAMQSRPGTDMFGAKADPAPAAALTVKQQDEDYASKDPNKGQPDLFAKPAADGGGGTVRGSGETGQRPGDAGASAGQSGSVPDAGEKPAEVAKPKATTPRQLAKAMRDANKPYIDPGDARLGLSNFDASGTLEGMDLLDSLASVDGLEARAKVADRWVLEQGRKNGVEYLVVLNADGVPLAISKGQASTVSADPSVFRLAAAGKIAYSVHNHPSSAGVSGQDISMLATGFAPVAIMMHNGERHVVSAGPSIGDLASGLKEWPAIPGVMNGDALGVALAASLQDVRRVLQGWLTARVISTDNISAVDRGTFALVMDRMGIVRYDGVTISELETMGVDFDGLYGQVSGGIRDRLGRAGFDVSEAGSDGGNQAAGSGAKAAPSGPESKAEKPAGTGTRRDEKGRVPVADKPKPPKKSSGDADMDKALDALFGTEDDNVSGPSGSVEQDRGDAASGNPVGAGGVPDAGRGAAGSGQRGNGAGAGGDGQSGGGGGVSGDDAASVGVKGNPGVSGGKRASGKPADGGKRAGSNAGGGRRLSNDDAGRTPATAQPSTGATGLSPAQKLAALRNLKNPPGMGEEVAHFGMREDPSDFDQHYYDGLTALLANDLAGVDLSGKSRNDLMMAVLGPLKDAGMTRAELVENAPYVLRMIDDIQSGRIVLDPVPPRDTPQPTEDRAATQAKADKVRVKMGDAENIDATLPLLLPEQRDDVLKIETRFMKPNAFGMMITNGTGTGKTYSGGGAIKRMVQAGKSNILVVAPSDPVLSGWKRALADLGVQASQLKNTKDAGSGVVMTTYSNLGDNDALAHREWDLIVTDESQHLMSGADAKVTKALTALRALSHRPGNLAEKSRKMHSDDWAKWSAMPKGDAKDAVLTRLMARQSADVERLASRPRSRVIFLSATPFARDKNVDYAEGYLFDYPADGMAGRSRQSGANLFMVQNFGYRIRYHKLTKPEAAVDSAVFEREFHERLKREGALSGRSLQIDVDYDRKFVTREDADGTRLDEALQALDDMAYKSQDAEVKKNAQALQDHMRKNFDYLERMKLLEAIKSRLASDDVAAHLAMGRKVIVFHDFNVGGGFNPFTHLKMRTGIDPNTGEEVSEAVSPMTVEAAAGYDALVAAHPWIRKLNFNGYKSPNEHFTKTFGRKAARFDGEIPMKQREQNLADFNRDGSGVDLLIVQADAGGAGISMHDTTGQHQRVLINLGMPAKPTTTLQEEGRALRVGTKTNVPFRYYTIGTTWERSAFARKIAENTGAVENLALGNDARGLTQSFIDAYVDAAENPPSATDGIGGKEADRAANVTSPFDRAKAHYFGRPKTSGRRDSREGVDFYPTPEPLALKMVEWAGIRANEQVLEPSAGDGAIVRYMPDGIDLKMIEPQASLASLAQLRAPNGTLIESTFEDYHLVNKAHVILMNPPFGSGGATAIAHLAKAARHLRPGGRIVALIPTGPSADKKFDAWFESDDARLMSWTADITLPSIAFEKAGTGVMTRVVVLDKARNDADMQAMPQFRRISLDGTERIGTFFDRLEQIGGPAARPVQVMDAADEIAQEAEAESAPARVGPPLATEAGAFTRLMVTSATSGKQFFAAAHAARVEKPVYAAMSGVAKSHNGWWHKTGRRDEGPTFAFRTEAQREAFLADMQKPTIGMAEDAADYSQEVFFSPLSRGVHGAMQPQPMFQRIPPQMVRDAKFAAAEITATMPALRAELDRLDLRRVSLFQREGVEWQGMFHMSGEGQMTILIGAAVDPMKTLHHEAIHAMRAANLFTDEEWAALEAEAKKWITEYDIATRYPDLSKEHQIEEAIAEAFAGALERRKAPGDTILARAFRKIERLLRVIRNAFAGRGFMTSEDIFGRVLSGEIGARRRAGADGRTAVDKYQRPGHLNPTTPMQRATRPTMQGALYLPNWQVWNTLRTANGGIHARLAAVRAAMGDQADNLRANLQDRMIHVKRTQVLLGGAYGAPLGEPHDAYLAEEMYSGRAGYKLGQINLKYTAPIIRIIAKNKGMSIETVGEYLYARHAQERNAHIATINPKMPDGGSGMTNAEAQTILAQYHSGKDAAAYRAISGLVADMREAALRERLNMGLIDAAEYATLQQSYADYVPLKGWEETDNADAMLDLSGIGRGFNVRGAESKRALGRNTEAFNPLIAAITQAQEVVIRAEKNRVGQHLYRLAKDFPEPNLWEVKTPKQVRYFNRSTGLVETRTEDPLSLIMAPNEMAVKVDGKEHRILFQDMRLAQAATRVGDNGMPALIMYLSRFSRYFSMINTMLNPVFVVKNFIRDTVTANVNIQGREHGGAIQRGMMRDLPKAMAGAYRGLGGTANTDWSRHFDEFSKAGGRVSFWTADNPEANRSKVERLIRSQTGGIAGKSLNLLSTSDESNPVLAAVERVNMAVDNAIRLSAFVNARRQGYSVQQAASLAKNLTVNFNRRGNWGSVINALYVFSNAGMQGTHALAVALKSRRVRVIVAGLVAIGFMLDQANTYLSDEDDDGQKFYDKIPDYKFDMNLIGMATGDTAGAMPLPYGYNTFFTFGSVLSKVSRGRLTPTQGVSAMMQSTLNAFSPIGGGDLMQTVTPTVLDPLADLSRNKNWLGWSIHPPTFGNIDPLLPKSSIAGSSTVASQVIAQGINAATGGDVAQKGALDLYPDDIDYIAAFLFGGMGRTMGQMANIGVKAAAGEPIESGDIPLVKDMVLPPSIKNDRSLFFDRAKAIEQATKIAGVYTMMKEPVPADVAWKAALDDVRKAAEKLYRGNKSTPADQPAAFLMLNGAYVKAWKQNGYTGRSIFEAP